MQTKNTEINLEKKSHSHPINLRIADLKKAESMLKEECEQKATFWKNKNQAPAAPKSQIEAPQAIRVIPIEQILKLNLDSWK
jgi:hypothetical protein